MLDGIKAIYESASPVPIANLVAAKQGRIGDPDDIARAPGLPRPHGCRLRIGVALPVDNAMSASLF